ncbi:MAG: BamA/TamA family outer membrane protein [Gemmatimonadota bacterium]
MLATLLLFAQVQGAATAQVPAAYADAATEALVTRARQARQRNERLVTAYTTTVSSRMGVGIKALLRDRMLYREEMVAKISWKRDSPSRIEFIGARSSSPIAERGDRVPGELSGNGRDLVFDPSADYLRIVGADGDPEGFSYPLREGGEADYTFALGDSTTIGLPGGKKIRILALQVTPRRSDWKLMSGTLWFDAETFGLVRAAFRPARPFEMRRDLDADDMKDVPKYINARGEVKFITLEYGLYENRWWMPRFVAIDAVGSMGSWMNVPFRLERVYRDYEVEGGVAPDPASTFRPAGRVAARPKRHAGEPEQDSTRGRWSNDSNLVVVIPKDTASLLTSPELGAPILDMGDLISESELKGLEGAIGALPDRKWENHVELPSGLSTVLQHARYNRIEALSLSANARADFGPLRVDALARIGLADGIPNGELSLTRETTSRRFSLAGYRRLAAANPDAHPLGAINSMLGLLAGRDDGEYFRTLGAEITAGSTTGGWGARLYYEQQRTADVETSASLPHLFDGDRRFRSNIVADRATQAGAVVTLRGSKALSRSFTLGAETNVEGGTGGFDFGKGAVTLRGFITPGGPIAGAFTLSAGTTRGDVPVQSQFYLGGAGSLRGYAGGVVSGNAFWLGRAEVGNSLPAVRLIGFVDAGWAGSRANFSSGRPLIGAGVGASFLDGLVRIDLARALRAPTGWRLEFYLDGLL